ncbi:MAG: N,N-dimethylformamidase beta subunit family domain-containing protein, partial [Elusimicrobiota bacterium]
MKKIFLFGFVAGIFFNSHAYKLEASCGSPINEIEAENCLPGTPPNQWDLPSQNAGDLTIQGFTTDISANKGETIRFKVNTPASAYSIDIYRMGYYAGNGARKIATISPSVPLPQSQPSCLTAPGQLIDCGNWSESASWVVPSTATSGVYFARLKRTDTGGASHIVFVVRDDASTSDIIFQTADTTWQAYNSYGGNSLYVSTGPLNRGFKVSYNRPNISRANTSNHVFSHEYPLIRWLEANAYSVSYFSGIDTDRRGTLVLNHKLFLSVGHDEYWSKAQRTHIENAQSAGIHTAFFSGNEMYWKTRYENSIDGSNTAYRTLVCYKESYESAPIDPLHPTWTGTWRDPLFSPPGDGGKPENAVIGQMFTVNAFRQDALVVSAADGKMRFWRNSSVSSLTPGTTVSFPEIIGYEWGEDIDNTSRPGGIIYLSSSTYFVPLHMNSERGTGYAPGFATHHLTLFKKESGAIVFGAGSMQWQWGLDSTHDEGSGLPAVPAIKQATVNLFADMGIQPANLQSGLIAASPSTDITAPTSTITFPLNGAVVNNGTPLIISGTASDIGGRVGAIEISFNNGLRWHPTQGREQWTYNWTPNIAGTVTIKCRAIDDSLNIEIPLNGISVTDGNINPTPIINILSPGSISVGSSSFTMTVIGSSFVTTSKIQWNGAERTTTFISTSTLTAVILATDVSSINTANITVFNPTPGGGISNTKPFSVTPPSYSLFPNTSPPSVNSSQDPNIEVGIKFRADVAGFITGLRFYKNTFNTGTHTGHLWSSTGTLLGTLTFSNETASGWQQTNFATPISINANTTYVASYFTTKGYAVTQQYFASAGVDNGPIHGLRNGIDGGNGVFKYGTSSLFPNNSYRSSNYWVDIIFTTPTASSNPVPILTGISPSSTTAGGSAFTLTATGNGFVSGSTIRWNGLSRTTNFISSTSLTALIPTSDIISSGTVNVSVFTSTPGGGTSASQIFTINPASNPAPILLSVSPSSTTAGGNAFTLTATGN